MSNESTEHLALAGRVDQLNRSVERLAEEYEKEGVKRDKRIVAANRASTRSRTVGIVGIVVGTIGVVAAIVALVVAGFATRDLHREVANVWQGRIASCVKANEDAQDTMRHDHNRDVILANNLAPLPRDASTQHKVDVFLAQEQTESVGNHPYRDCTRPGVERYLTKQRNPPPTTLPATIQTAP